MSDDLIQLNLDSVDRERVYESFHFVLGGRKIQMIDPAELPWQFLENLDREMDVITEAMTEDDRKFFMAQDKLPAWKLERLVRDYQDHFGIDTEGKGA